MRQFVRNPERIFWLVATAAGACGDAPAATSTALGEVPALGLVEELRIGSLEDPDVGFSSIGSIHVEPSGDMYVFESADQQIRHYGPDGRLLHRYGRKGDGPGEFRQIFGYGVQGDTVWVSDGRHRRLTIFDRDAEVLGTVTGRADVPLGKSQGTAFSPDRSVTIFPNELGPGGRFIGRASLVRYPNLPDSIVDVPTLLFAADGSVIDTLEVVPRVVSFPALLVSFTTTRGSTLTSSVPIDPPMPDSGSFGEVVEEGDTVTLSWAVSGSPPTGVLTVTREADEGVSYRTSLSYAPRAVDPGYLDSLAAARPRRLQLSPSDSAELAAKARSVMQMPPHHRPFTNSNATTAGGIWIRLDDADPQANRWLVLGADGRIRGVSTLSPGARIGWSDEDHVWLIERDELDVSWLVRYRLADAP